MHRGGRLAVTALSLGMILLAAASTANVAPPTGGAVRVVAGAPRTGAEATALAVRDNAPLPVLLGDAPSSPAAQTRLLEGPVEEVLYGAPESDPSRRAAVAKALDLFAHRLDVTRDIALGDRVRLLVRQRSGEAVELDYAELDGASARVRLYREDGEGRGSQAYLDESGVPLDRFLLRTPLRIARITSGFGPRLHPLLGYGRMHGGVDFSAAPGTPVLAAGDGTVVAAGWAGGYGRRLVVRHAGGAETLYAHLSGMASGAAPGALVSQGQVIGWTGASGQVTGPHLHYEVRLRGVAVDPAQAGPSVPASDLQRRLAFDARKQAVARLLAACEAADAGPCLLS
ncbi:M23 family metallopeptidase [Caulobacter endophyticus]|uniref:M23 family metallopeptidase n=1 Tax=Caulobacter endophyticus TaxID=2172652 RepID=UPI00240EA6B6|nr:M23 family metallopeptidase [Caulobacter endophyticus]MDG2527255.1 M23 family metallopeptidase [Caulobacter endophyticus]